MEIVTLNSKDCTRWQYADRSNFEMGNLSQLAEDIRKNGQIEPVIVRPALNSSYKYEVVAGSRRFQACLQADLPLKAVIQELNDQQAFVAQLKENEKESISDYSKGLFYAKLLADNKSTKDDIKAMTGLSRMQLDRFLCFKRVPDRLWQAVGNMSKVSARAAETLAVISNRSNEHLEALVEMAGDIRKGIGSRRIEAMVNARVEKGSEMTNLDLKLPNGQSIGTWQKQGIKFDASLNVDRQALAKCLVQFFENQTQGSSKVQSSSCK